MEKEYREKIIEILDTVTDTKLLAFVYGILRSITK